MSEWLKERAWKVRIWETVSRVRIPLSPQERRKTHDLIVGFLFSGRRKLAYRRPEKQNPSRRRRTGFCVVLQGLPQRGSPDRREGNPALSANKSSARASLWRRGFFMVRAIELDYESWQAELYSRQKKEERFETINFNQNLKR